MVLPVVCGLVAAVGVVSLVLALAGTTAPRRPGLLARWRMLRTAHAAERDRMARQARWVTAGLLAASLWPATGAFVVAVAAGLAVVGVPWLLTPTRSAATRIARLEALSEWTQRLADVLRLGKGLEQTLIDSRAGAPAAIADQVADLSDRLRIGVRPAEALRAFGDDLGDVTADKVVAALLLSVQAGGPGLAASLEALASSTRDEVARYRQIEADRAKPRTTVRWMVVITVLVFAAGLLNPDYTAPYASLPGQMALAVVVLGFVGVLVWMRSMTEHRPTPRFLIADPRSVVATPPAPPVGGRDRKGRKRR